MAQIGMQMVNILAVLLLFPNVLVVSIEFTHQNALKSHRCLSLQYVLVIIYYIIDMSQMILFVIILNGLEKC